MPGRDGIVPPRRRNKTHDLGRFRKGCPPVKVVKVFPKRGIGNTARRPAHAHLRKLRVPPEEVPREFYRPRQMTGVVGSGVSASRPYAWVVNVHAE